MAAAGTAPLAAALLALLALGACTHQRAPLNERAVLNELRRRDPAVMEQPGDRRRGSPVGTLSADEAVELALKHNPELKAVRHTRGVAEGNRSADTALENPELRLELKRLDPPIAREWELQLRWSPPQPWERSALGAKGDAAVKEAEENIREQELDLESRVRMAHATATELLEQLKLADAAQIRRRKLVDSVRRRVAQGASTRFDLDAAQLLMLEGDRDRLALDIARNHALFDLARLMGLSLDGRTTLKPAKPPPVVAEGYRFDLHDLEERALAARPAMAAARARYEGREQTLRAEQVARLPWISLMTGVSGPLDPDDNSDPGFDVGVGISIPIFDWNAGGIQAATAERAMERDLTVGLISDIRNDIAKAVAEIERRAQTLRFYAEKELPVVTEHERVIDLAFKAAQFDLPTLLAAEEAAIKGKRAYSQALVEYHRAWLWLDRIIGEPLSETLEPAAPAKRR
jgi:cobalt-zinc-cadmium efflux system outer membrane protein